MATKYTYHPNVTFPGNGWIEPAMDEESPLVEESIALEICERLNEAALDREDAERWRYIRRKLCLTGNGDGTCAMHAISLPSVIPGWPDPGKVDEFCDAAIDAARAAKGADHA